MTGSCFICGDTNKNVLQTHHIVPDRHGGRNSSENTVRLCANCHAAVERLYDRRFYRRLKEELELVEEAEPEDADLVIQSETTECPVCGRTQNRRGVSFTDGSQVVSHIMGSHDDDHDGVKARID
jgi:5-methylcytosine-specific restriction endonuclease McrA